MNPHEYGRYPNIERWMQENGTSMTKLATLLDVSYKTVQRLMNGKTTRPYSYVREAIQRVTGMSFDEAFQKAKM